MAFTPQQLTPTQAVPTTVTAVYTTPAGARAIIRQAVLTNVTNGPHTVTIHVVPAAGSPTTDNIITFEQRLGPAETQIVQPLLNTVLTGGVTVQAVASSAASVNITLGGLFV
jgi:hypothetical protein